MYQAVSILIGLTVIAVATYYGLKSQKIQVNSMKPKDYKFVIAILFVLPFWFLMGAIVILGLGVPQIFKGIIDLLAVIIGFYFGRETKEEER